MTATTLPAMPNYGDPPVTVRVAAPGLVMRNPSQETAASACGRERPPGEAGREAIIRWDGPPLSLTIARRIDRHLYVMAEAEPDGGHPRLFAAGAGIDAPTAIATALDAMADKLEPVT